MPSAAENPLQWWVPADHVPALTPGMVLRARDGNSDDPFSVVRVVATHRVRDLDEAVVTPALSFGENVSAPISGAGGLLAIYDALTEAEVADLLPAADPEAAERVDVNAARHQLEQARAAAQEAA